MGERVTLLLATRAEELCNNAADQSSDLDSESLDLYLRGMTSVNVIDRM
jgi:hypothetical protein